MDSTEMKYSIKVDEKHGYKRLDPIPSEEILTEFYENHYFEMTRAGKGGDPGIRRLMLGGSEADQERTWKRATTFSDICYLINKYATGGRILDIGCGTGEFLSYAHENGFDTVGVEPSKEAAIAAESRGLVVHQGVLEDIISNDVEPFDAIIFLNVLEHNRDPADVLEKTKQIVKPGGLIGAIVPNDFSEIQCAAKEYLNKEESWWVSAPDHINYFDCQSIRAFFESLGLEVVYQQSDFPMEVFLLMGLDYLGNSDIGAKCHKKRVALETALPDDLRRKTYQALASAGLGRDCLTFGRLTSS